MTGAGISFVVGSAKGGRGQLQMPGALEASEWCAGLPVSKSGAELITGHDYHGC